MKQGFQQRSASPIGTDEKDQSFLEQNNANDISGISNAPLIFNDSISKPTFNGHINGNLNGHMPQLALMTSSKGLKPIQMKVQNSMLQMRNISKAQELNDGNFLSNEEIIAHQTPRDDDLQFNTDFQPYKFSKQRGKLKKFNKYQSPIKSMNGSLYPATLGTTSKKDPFSQNGSLKKGQNDFGEDDDQEIYVPPIHPVRPWNMVPEFESYKGKVDDEDIPHSLFNDPDLRKRMKFDKLKNIRMESLCRWKQEDIKGSKKNAYIKEIQKKNDQILKVNDKTELEKLEVYTDRFPCLNLRKELRRLRTKIHLFAKSIIDSKIFDRITITVILSNSFVMLLESEAPDSNDPGIFFEVAEEIFLYLYTTEMVLKIMGMGFIMGNGAYIKDAWNMLDFSIVFISYFTKIMESSQTAGGEEDDSAFSPASLRVFRVLRPLRAISSIKGLRVLMVALFSALPMLGETLMILMFFFIIYSIGGAQLFGGELKHRCFDIQTGIIHPDDIICGDLECPPGNFCAKSNSNPNGGVTSFDNLFWSILQVFQCVTMEGWSDIQLQYQQAYTYIIFIYFSPLVLIGSFFLLNLTLAVINSKFTEAHSEQTKADLEEKRAAANYNIATDEISETIQRRDDMSIAQFITARIYAKKMIEFLRMRQEIKRIERDRLEKVKARALRASQYRRTFPVSQGAAGANPDGRHSVSKLELGQSRPSQLLIDNYVPKSSAKDVNGSNHSAKDVGNNVIEEEDQEHMEEQSDAERDKAMQVNGQKAGRRNKEAKQNGMLRAGNGSSNAGPTMKGNIGPQVKKNETTQNQNSKLAEEYDIDNIIPKDEQKNEVSQNFEPDDSMQSFDMSIKNMEFNYDIESSDRSRPHTRGDNAVAQSNGFDQVQVQEMYGDNESGLVTSDSDFDNAEKAAGYKMTLPQQQHRQFTQLNSNTADVRRDVSKTFKKMLTANNQRGATPYEKNIYGDETSTKWGGSQKPYSKFGEPQQDFDNHTQISEIENKFKKKKDAFIKRLQKKGTYKEDEDELRSNSNFSNFLEDKFKGKTTTNVLQKTKKEDIRRLEEFISIRRPKDPFKDLDPLVSKVDIAPDTKYQGTSQNDVFQQRLKDRERLYPMEENHFLKLPKEMQKVQEDDTYAQSAYVRSTFKPFQQKVVYDIHEDSSPLEDEGSSDNENMLYLKEQPYATPTSVNYGPLLKQIAIQELARRSDVLITSTLSMTMYPKDKRMINLKKRALLSKSEIQDYIDEKSAFQAMVKEHEYQCRNVRDKDKDYRDNYLKSFIHKSAFESGTLTKFKTHTMMLNSNTKQDKIKDKEVLKAERLKHEQNKRASEKRGLPTFDLELAKKLLEGKFHEEVEDEDGEPVAKTLMGQEVRFMSKEEVDHQNRMDQFETALKKILNESDEDKPIGEDEIPRDVRKQFKLPKEMGIYEVNFPQIRKSDISKKKQRPMWSGQDVMPIQLDESKSTWVIEHINQIRVWPPGLRGIIKRMRSVLRIKVKSGFFDNLMTFAVLLNTIALAINHHDMELELEDLLTQLNLIFTWVFIYEMGSKVVAVGVVKYCSDKMNYLDGGVVLLSIFEMAATELMQGDGTGLSAFKTVRMLRTFRVFRIARLLRALESMQTIIHVMVKSYKSFIYITLLMFLFIYIFALLGISMFGNSFNFEDRLPRGNYDNFTSAFITIFQVLTMENWQTVLYDSMRTSISPFMVAAFYISWIFVGNFILLNLFLAILLDSFLEEEEEEESAQLDAEKKRKKMIKARKKKQALDNERVFMSAQFYAPTEKKPQRSKFYFGQEKSDAEEDLEDLDEDQIVKIFKQQGIIKQDKEEIRAQPLFVGVECAQSFYLFSKDNLIRVMCYKAYKHASWESGVMALILLSSAKLATDTYGHLWEDDVTAVFVMAVADYFFTIAFIIEMVIKLIALGFLMDEGSYLRDNWNRLDFFIVVTSIVELSFQGLELPIIKIFRMLRTLRPLRFISHNVAMRLIVGALIESVGSILNVLIVVAVVYLIFAIVGVSLFGGGFWYCSIDRYTLHTLKQCLKAGGEWRNQDHNFDDVVAAMQTLFVVSSLEGWPDIMFFALDFTGQDKGPTYNHSPEYMSYFVLFILIGSFFFLNFFIGVLFLEYNKAQREEQKGFTAKDLGWMDIQRLILSASPDYETTNVPKQQWRRKFHTLVSASRFESFIMGVIMVNMVQMACLHEGQSAEFAALLDVTNYVFTAIFFLEAVLKLIGYGSSYFNNSWNKFDFFVVVASLFDVVMSVLGESSFSWLSSAPQIARVMRVLRVARIVRLAGKAKNLQAIIQTIQFSIPSLLNVFLLLLLIFFMFAILGNFAFGEVRSGEVVTELKNFGTFLNSFLFLFALSTGEDWNKVMYDCSRQSEAEGGDGCIKGSTCGTSWSFAYFMMMILICTHVMLNLFILVIIQQFEKYYLPQDNMIALFKIDQARFMQVWKEFTQDRYQCLKIKENQLTKFFRKLGEQGEKEQSLGFSEEYYEDGELKKQLLKMAIKSDNGYIYFNELLYRCMRRKYGNMKINKKMQVFELRTQYGIYLMTLAIQKNTKALSNDDIFNSIVKKENGVNPFLTVMNFKISFKTWLKVARKRIKDRERARDRAARGESPEVAGMDDAGPRLIAVDIEVEHVYSCTSEEDSLIDRASNAIESLMRQKSINKSGKGRKSIFLGQAGDLNSSDISHKKPRDHLKLFQKKMSAKLRSQLSMSQSSLMPKKAQSSSLSKSLMGHHLNQQSENKPGSSKSHSRQPSSGSMK